MDDRFGKGGNYGRYGQKNSGRKTENRYEAGRRESTYGKDKAGAKYGYGSPKPAGYGERREGGYGAPRSDDRFGTGERQDAYGYKRAGGDKPVVHSAKKAAFSPRIEDAFHKRAGGDKPVFHSAKKKEDRFAAPGEYRKSSFGKATDGRKPLERPYSTPQNQSYRNSYTPGNNGGLKASYAQHELNPEKERVQQQTAEQPYFIMGRNAVREAVKSGRSIDRILVLAEQDGSLREVVGMARDRRLVIQEVSKAKLDEMCMPFGYGGRPGNHQGIVALVPDVEYSGVDELLAVAAQKGEPPFIIVLDGIEDTHNLGSIIRSAECAGAHGVIIPKRRSASVTAAVAKESSGAVEYIKIAKVTNITSTLNDLKKAGLWIVGAVMNETPMDKAKLSGPIALVIGSEGSGISRLAMETCDMLVSIPLFGKIDALNASVAAAVLMFEKKRQDGFTNGNT